jgi:hypothetical protein
VDVDNLPVVIGDEILVAIRLFAFHDDDDVDVDVDGDDDSNCEVVVVISLLVLPGNRLRPGDDDVDDGPGVVKRLRRRDCIFYYSYKTYL